MYHIHAEYETCHATAYYRAGRLSNLTNSSTNHELTNSIPLALTAMMYYSSVAIGLALMAQVPHAAGQTKRLRTRNRGDVDKTAKFITEENVLPGVKGEFGRKVDKAAKFLKADGGNAKFQHKPHGPPKKVMPWDMGWEDDYWFV